MDDVEFPIRCQSCSYPIGNVFRTYVACLAEEQQNAHRNDTTDETHPAETLTQIVLRRLGIERPCCRRHFLTHPLYTHSPLHEQLYRPPSSSAVNAFLRTTRPRTGPVQGGPHVQSAARTDWPPLKFVPASVGALVDT